MRLATITLASLILSSPACGPKAPPEGTPPAAAVEPAPTPAVVDPAVPPAAEPVAAEPVAEPAPAPVEPAAEPAPAAEVVVVPTAPKTSHAERWALDIEDSKRYVRTLFQRPDGSFIALGGTREIGTMKVLMTAIDKDGKVLWEKTHGGDNNRLAIADLANGGGAALGDGGFILVGKRSGFDMTHQVWVARFSADGAPVWEANIGDKEEWAVANWLIALGADHALVSVSRGDLMAPTRSFVKISLADGAVVETVAAPGDSEPPERSTDGILTTYIMVSGADGTTRAPFNIDATSGAVTARADASPAAWEKAGGEAVTMASTPLVGGGRLLVTRALGESAKTTFVTTDIPGSAIWRWAIEDAGTDSVRIVCATNDGGFAYVAERSETDDKGLRDPAGVRIVRMD